MPERPPDVAVAASPEELPAANEHWGHGGWQPPREREALDWLTLARLLGWEVAADGVEDALAIPAPVVVLACDPDLITEAAVASLRRRLEREPLLVVCRAPAAGSPLALLTGAHAGDGDVSGTTLEWLGPGERESWRTRAPLDAARLDLACDVEPWGRLAGAPAAVARPVGLGAVVTLAFHPSAARDAEGAATALLRRLLVSGQRRPTAWLDFERTLVLRMDDPGGAQNVHCRDWCYAPLGEGAWRAIRDELRRRAARLSVLYTPGWVDDGDAARGRLVLGDAEPERVPGAIHPSPLVRYEDVAGHAPGRVNDYRSEYRGIEALRAAGLGDVELHGHTHLHPDLAAWFRAGDRYDSMSWFRELGRDAQPAIDRAPPDGDPLAAGIAALERWFGTRPTTLVPPGDEFSAATLDRAHALGLELVDSYYLALRDGARFCWSHHVCAPYLDLAEARWLDAGLPVVGYLHDEDVARHGVDWLARGLDAWQEAGARHLVDFRELAGALARRVRVDQVAGADRLVVEADADAPALVRPLRVVVEFLGAPPARMDTRLGGRDLALDVVPAGRSSGRVRVPLDPADAR